MEGVVKLTEKTLVPVSLILVLLGGVLWLSEIYAMAKHSTEEIKSIKLEKRQDLDAINAKFDRILSDLNYIKGRVERK